MVFTSVFYIAEGIYDSVERKLKTWAVPPGIVAKRWRRSFTGSGIKLLQTLVVILHLAQLSAVIIIIKSDEPANLLAHEG